MHKMIVFCFVGLLCTASLGQEVGANSSNKNVNKKLERAARKAALETCNCINSTINGLHPLLQSLVNNAVDQSEENAQSIFAAEMSKLSPEEQQQIYKDIAKMKSIDSETSECIGTLKEKYGEYDNSKEFTQAALEALKSIPKCKLLYRILEKEGAKKK